MKYAYRPGEAATGKSRMRFDQLDQFRIAIFVLGERIGQAFPDLGPVVG